MIDRLEAKALVERARTPGDRRGVPVSATPRVFHTVGERYRSCAIALREMVMSYPAAGQVLAVRHLTEAAAEWEVVARSGTKA